MDDKEGMSGTEFASFLSPRRGEVGEYKNLFYTCKAVGHDKIALLADVRGATVIKATRSDDRFGCDLFFWCDFSKLSVPYAISNYDQAHKVAPWFSASQVLFIRPYLDAIYKAFEEVDQETVYADEQHRLTLTKTTIAKFDSQSITAESLSKTRGFF